uniref:Carboxylesterase type B domain-containing protein n=1 Tax=Arion vulgaris TaxID=1028688 RepID=A0A0B7AJG0_9EUPU
MMTISVTWLLLFIVSCVSSDSHDENTRIQVATPSGTFRGIIQQSLQSHSYAAFLGIPYALPPVGNLRFAKPEPYPHIDTVFDASTAAPSCVQSSRLNVSSYGQEDCLYLNVYVPLEENESIGNGDTFKKVFVFIHGGDWLTGSANQYVPGDMVALGDIIVVTFNYRLSWLGFLKGPTPELSGNQGIWDQLLALNWVRNNIRSFGGDPYDVTAGGHAMGAKSVSLLSIVPQAKTLFTKGIISSSSMFKDASTVGSSDDLLEILAKKVGCKESDHTKTIECLRNLPVESFLTPPDLSVAQIHHN